VSRWLYHCLANGPLGRFGDYVWADTKAEAEVEFHRIHGVYPTWLQRKKGAWS
jgi:hypothetical protein